MGGLATPKARSARSLASASTPVFRHRISTRSGCSYGSCESFWNAVAGRRSSLSKRSSSGSRWCPERDRLLDSARRREIDIIPSGLRLKPPPSPKSGWAESSEYDMSTDHESINASEFAPIVAAIVRCFSSTGSL